MSHKIIPSNFIPLLELIRFNKPIGFTLLMWPCWFALASLPINHIQYLKWYALFLFGSFLMRSSGCIINDIIDVNIDKNIQRTAQRPLVTKKVSILEALIFLMILLFCSLLILLQFNTKAIFIGLLSIPFIIFYPLMKRIMYWPQFILGIVFSWGVLIVSMQFNNYLSVSLIVLYVGCIFWTLGYDTIYAYQDREDDIKSNIKSTAVLFGKKGKKYVLSFYLIFFVIIGLIGFENSSSFASILVLIPFLIAIIVFLNKWNLESKNSSNYYFNFNNYLGLLCFIYLIIF